MNITLNINAYTIDSHLVCDQVNGIIYAKMSTNDSKCATFHIPSEALTNYRMSFVFFSLSLSPLLCSFCLSACSHFGYTCIGNSMPICPFQCLIRVWIYIYSQVQFVRCFFLCTRRYTLLHNWKRETVDWSVLGIRWSNFPFCC